MIPSRCIRSQNENNKPRNVMKLMRPTKLTEIVRPATLLCALAAILAAGMTLTAAEPPAGRSAPEAGR